MYKELLTKKWLLRNINLRKTNCYSGKNTATKEGLYS